MDNIVSELRSAVRLIQFACPCRKVAQTCTAPVSPSRRDPSACAMRELAQLN